MSIFTKIADFNLPEIPYRFVGGGQDYSPEKTISDNLQVLKNIKDKYGNYIKNWASVFELGDPVLISFIAVESSGEMVGKNRAGAIGLTQVTILALIEAITKFKEVTGEEIPAKALAVIKNKAPYLLKLSRNNQDLSSSNTSKLETLLKKDADFNIMMGALSLRWVLDFTRANNISYLQKAIIAYNQGAYARIRDYKNKFVTTLTLFKDKAIPKETRNYLVKVLGKNGYFELYSSNNI